MKPKKSRLQLISEMHERHARGEYRYHPGDAYGKEYWECYFESSEHESEKDEVESMIKKRFDLSNENIERIIKNET